MTHQWKKRVGAAWLQRRQVSLEARFYGRIAFVDRPGGERTLVEICCRDRAEAAALRGEFGGTIAPIPRDLVKAFARYATTRPVAVGRRLIVQGERVAAARRKNSPPVLVIPASAAFGTGAHATTAFCLRLLERLTRGKSSWSLLDVGTGTGVLALAGKIFGAERVVAIDFDPHAISIARQNARADRVRGVEFHVADAVRFRARRRFDVITANLFSELLIAALPNFTRQLRADGRLILSGILRTQEKEIARALRSAGFAIAETRRRGKWIALVAHFAPGKSR